MQKTVTQKQLWEEIERIKITKHTVAELANNDNEIISGNAQILDTET